MAALPASTIRLGLDRIREALTALGEPQRRFAALHVAGTNGKGSTCAFAESCLRHAGHKVGLYTSPHLVRVNERIKVGGIDISDEAMGERILEVLDRYPRAEEDPFPLTYFELGTLVALWHFAQEQVEIAVLETGLGGRLDATTASEPWVTAVTSISFDHMQLLGSTLAAIAIEKAGIFKPSVPAVIAAQEDSAAQALLTRAEDVGSPTWIEGRDFSVGAGPEGTLSYQSADLQLEGVRLGLKGDHQRHNAAVALASLERLRARGMAIPDSCLRQGLSLTRWPGRLEEIGSQPKVLLDGAHNVGGVEALVAALSTLFPGQRVHLVFGVLADKEYAPMLERLVPRCTSVHLAPLPNPRSLAPLDYLDQVRTLCPDSHAYPSVFLALEGARRIARGTDLIVGAGSLVLVGELRAELAAT